MSHRTAPHAAPGNQAVEHIYQAFKELKKEQKIALGARILNDPGIDNDALDHFLIERSSREKGKDITLAAYLGRKSKHG